MDILPGGSSRQGKPGNLRNSPDSDIGIQAAARPAMLFGKIEGLITLVNQGVNGQAGVVGLCDADAGSKAVELSGLAECELHFIEQQL